MRYLFWTFLVILTAVTVQAVTDLTGPYGSFESPLFPDAYPNDLDLQWRIQVREGYRIALRFTVFDVEDSYDDAIGGACVYDYFVISENGDELYRFCGSSRHYPTFDAPRLNTNYYSKGNVLAVRFVSDYSNENPQHGFSAHYIEEDIDECARLRQKEQTTLEDWDELITCNHFCVNVPGSYYCDCRAGFELDSNKHTCVAKFCENVRLTDRSGVIESPDYPRSYGKLSNCQWDINVEKGLSIDVTFDEPFDIEKHYQEGCVYDKLTVIHKGTSIGYCGTSTPHANTTWDLNTRDVQILFQSDLSVERTGFRLRYNTTKIRCLSVLQAPANGLISSSNPKGYYEFEDVVTFSCNIGYDLIGDSSITCDNEGNWTNDEPTCRIISCGEPTNLTSVRYSQIVDRQNKRFEYLERVTVQCDKWYEQTQGFHTWKCEHTKKWVPEAGNRGGGETPLCRPMCGRKGAEDNSLLSVQVSGGTKSKAHEWPWLVFLNFGRIRNLGTNGAMCSGALINPLYILTAAHCVYTPVGHRRSPSHIHAWLGVPNRTVEEGSVKYVNIAQIIPHPKYNRASKWNFDVALLKLNETLIMSDTIRPVCLPSTAGDYGMNRPETSGEVAAWGLYDAGFQTSMFLLHGEFPIVTSQHCLASMKRKSVEIKKTFPANLFITENMFCAGYEEGNQGTCQGDSGAPFVVEKGNTSIYYELGLVSFGVEECGSTVSFTAFTKMNLAIVQWIMQNTNNLIE